jgi:hypothetical protein
MGRMKVGRLRGSKYSLSVTQAPLFTLSSSGDTFPYPNLGEIVDSEQGISFGEFARGIVEKNTTKG